MLEKKINDLKNYIKDLKKVSIGFSGGKDSLFLILISIRAIGNNNVLPVFIDLEYIDDDIRKRVDYFYKKYELNLIKSDIDINNNFDILNNTEMRCYWCKRLIYEKIRKISFKYSIKNICDGSNYSDMSKHRPGLKALKELNIIKPLAKFKIIDNEIYDYLKNIENIDEKHLTSTTCNLVKLPHNTPWKQYEKF